MSIFLILLTITAFGFLPFFANPSLLLDRNNDLTEFFWPLFYYIKQNILINHTVPFENTMWFAGTPLLPDPQNPIWYLPNIIFLFSDINTAIFVSLFVHTLFGAFGAYIMSRQAFNFTKRTSIFVSSLFIVSPIYFSFLEAGHWGLAISWNWLPYIIFSSYKLANKPSLGMILLFAASASSIFFNHIPTASIIAFPILIYFLFKRRLIYPFAASILTFLIISPAFFAQLSWQPQTTRSILLKYAETFPVWLGEKEFFKSIFLFNPQNEKAITFGIIPSLLGLFGFLLLKAKYKLFLGSFVLLLTLISLNNASPILPLLQSINYFVLLRVMTRVWILAILVGIYLYGLALEKLNKKLVIILGTLAIFESTYIGYSYLLKQIHPRENIPVEMYETLEADKDSFKVLCLSRCIPQKEAALRNLQLVEGYGTLQNLTYYYHIQSALNTKWNKYSLSIPPFDVYLFQDLQPNASLLADSFNAKYVISKHLLKDETFRLNKKSGAYYLYINTLFQR